MSKIQKTFLPKSSRIVYSTSHLEARRKVLALYKKFNQSISEIMILYPALPLTYKQYHAKIREEFEKNKSVKDLRVIDMLVHQGYNDLNDLLYVWKQGCHVMNYFNYTAKSPIRSNFMERFLNGTSSIM